MLFLSRDAKELRDAKRSASKLGEAHCSSRRATVTHNILTCYVMSVDDETSIHNCEESHRFLYPVQ